MIDILTVESPRYCDIARNPIAAARIVVHGYVPNVDGLGLEAGNRHDLEWIAGKRQAPGLQVCACHPEFPRHLAAGRQEA